MSRHRLVQPQNFKSSEFRIRAPKNIQQESSNHKNVYPTHLSASSQQENKQENNEFEHDYYEFEQDYREFEQNHEFEQDQEFKQNYQEFEWNHEFEQEHQEFEQNYEFEHNYQEFERNYEFEQDYESDSDFIINNDPKTFDGKKNFFSNENNSEFGPFNSFTIMAFFLWITKHMICK
jgi:hypothetical protein